MSSVSSLFENLALVTSGLAISTENAETDSASIHTKISSLYIDNLEYWATKAHTFADLAPFVDQLSALQKQQLGQGVVLSGPKLWNKYKLLVRGINTTAGPIWAKITNNGEPPTGTKLAEWLLSLRKALHAEAKKTTAFTMTWYPNYWLAFLHYGPCADEATASDAFAAKRSNGPTPKRPAEELTHHEQRILLSTAATLNRTEIRELERRLKKPKRESDSASLAAVLSRANDIEERKQKRIDLEVLYKLSKDPKVLDMLLALVTPVVPAPAVVVAAPVVVAALVPVPRAGVAEEEETSDSGEE